MCLRHVLQAAGGDGSSSAAAWQAAARSSSSNPLARACSGCQCPVSGSCAKRQRGGAHSASPGRPAALAAAGRRGRGVNSRPNHSWLRPKGGTGPPGPLAGGLVLPAGAATLGVALSPLAGWLGGGRKRRSSVFAPTSNLQAAPSTPSAADIPHSTAPTSTARKEPDESNRRSTRPTMSADAHGRNRRAQLISTHPPTQLSV